MAQYQKINTIFMRDEKNIIMPFHDFVRPELTYLRGLKFRGEEKIDGTNIRLEVVGTIRGEEAAEFSVSYKGKSDNATIPQHLYEYLTKTFPPEKVLASLNLKAVVPVSEFAEHNWVDGKGKPAFGKVPTLLTIYGEGYGMKIQKGGGRYIHDGVSFRVFDVKVGDWYLLTEARDEIAQKLGAETTPLIGYFTLDEAIDFVRKGFVSTVSEDKTLPAEGLVLRTDLGLRSRSGERIMTKIKTCDFIKYRAVYGTDGPVEQVPNHFLSGE